MFRFTITFTFLFLITGLQSFGQFAPQAGKQGTTAIHQDSSIIQDWLNPTLKSTNLHRGWMNIADTSLGRATAGDSSTLTGPPGNGIISLGDGGSIEIIFDTLLDLVKNLPGPDFVVFENGFPFGPDSNFLELAFVEVTPDYGKTWYRFPAQSLTDTVVQTESFGSLIASKIHNLAGKFIAPYGVPFDLDDIVLPLGGRLSVVSGIRIIDVVGSLEPLYTSRDSAGRKINDPWPTPFPSSGFDLDAIGIIHPIEGVGLVKIADTETGKLFPNPSNSGEKVEFIPSPEISKITSFSVQDLLGNNLIIQGEIFDNHLSFQSPETTGIYILKVNTTLGLSTTRLVVN